MCNTRQFWLIYFQTTHLRELILWICLDKLQNMPDLCSVESLNDVGSVVCSGLPERTRAAERHSPTQCGQLGVRTGEAVRVLHRGAWSVLDICTWTWTPTETRFPACGGSC